MISLFTLFFFFFIIMCALKLHKRPIVSMAFSSSPPPSFSPRYHSFMDTTPSACLPATILFAHLPHPTHTNLPHRRPHPLSIRPPMDPWRAAFNLAQKQWHPCPTGRLTYSVDVYRADVGDGRRLHIVADAGASGPIVAEPSSVRKARKAALLTPDDKLVKLRSLFESAGGVGIDAYIIPSEDPHQSEFMADCFMRRAYISRFTGSAGTAVVTKGQAALWTDGRYFLQAEKQMGSEWLLMRTGIPGVPAYGEWLRDNLVPGSKVGIDPFLFSFDAAMDLKRCLLEKNHELVLLHDINLVDQVWGDERLGSPSAPLRVHDIKYAGVDVVSKLENLRRELNSMGATAIIVTMLDEVAWLFNLRGNDVPHSPVAYAYAIVELETATLFVEESKITSEVSSHLRVAQIIVKPYTALLSELQRLARVGAKLWLDSSHVSVGIVNAFDAACSNYYESLHGSSNFVSGKGLTGNPGIHNYRFELEKNGPAGIHKASPIIFSKAIKNSVELDGMKQAHLRDAAAMVEFWAWLEKKIVIDKETVSEVEVADSLLKFRAKQAGFLDTSFDTISGSGPNGAIVHYRAEPGSCRVVDDQQIFLLDSGGQYVDGTTDITRTVHFGIPNSRQKECYTRVLQGHIAVDKAIFPQDTPGFVLDILARAALWTIGLDYRHGTGHGVGAALNVHEGPQSISTRYWNLTGLQPGMVISNEPGYYEDGAFGIRIENLLVVHEVETANHYGGITYLGFERLTYVPIQKELMEVNLMTDDEINWVNNYHSEVWEKVSPLVEGDALEWLQSNTTPISRNASN